MKELILALVFIIVSTTIVSAQGTIRGSVRDSVKHQVLPGAVVKVKVNGENQGVLVDYDGNYELSVPSGSYTVIFSKSNEGYLDLAKEVTVQKDEILVLNVVLSIPAETDVDVIEFVYWRPKEPITIENKIVTRIKAKELINIVSKEEMEQSGARNVVEALMLSPGVTIEDGKHVYIRGLGGRYTKTILNGMEIPGLDPDRNSVQLDIFPAAVIDNITIHKTFVPNWSGDYTGGLVNISTKGLPKKRYIYAKAGLGYNQYATFNSQYRTYAGGNLDFLGFDDGTRALQLRQTDNFPNPALNDPLLQRRTAAFSNVMASSQAAQFLNQNYSFGYGDRISFRDSIDPTRRITYGYTIVANYRNSHRFYEDVEYGEYRLESTNGVPQNDLEKSRVAQGQQSEQDVLWTTLIGQSLKWGRSTIDLTLFRTQNGKSSTAFLREEDFEDNPGKLERTSLEYTQRSVSNVNLSGSHFLDSTRRWSLDWTVSPTLSSIEDPDIRSTALSYETDAFGHPTSYDFDPAVGAQTLRIWRSLKEYNLGGRFDFTYKFKIDSTRKSEISFGGLNTYRERDFEILQYLFEYRNGDDVTFSADPDWYFQEENIWSAETDQGMWVNSPLGPIEPANNFNARQNVAGAYIMNQLPITDKLDVSYGARVENAKNWYSGQNNFGDRVFNDTLILDNWNILPSLNAVYRVQQKSDSVHTHQRYTNYRVAYATTVARPSFKEKSLAQIFDPLQGRTYNGNIDLQQTTIHNFDARWEHFFGRTELISFGGFFKHFIDPIELIAFNTAPDNVQPLNTGTAQVFGGEVEIRKAIGFNKSNQKHLNLVVGGNFTYVVSRVDLRTSYIPIGAELRQEKEVRQENARVGEVIGNYRQMYGQSPYILNAFATFRNDSLGLIVNINYNVQGKKLAVIGTGRIPDVFEQPFHSLNIKASKTFGSAKQWEGSLAGRNLLLARRVRQYESFGAVPQIYSAWSPGFSISASISYNFKGKKKKQPTVTEL